MDGSSNIPGASVPSTLDIGRLSNEKDTVIARLRELIADQQRQLKVKEEALSVCGNAFLSIEVSGIDIKDLFIITVKENQNYFCYVYPIRYYINEPNILGIYR